MSRIAVGGTSPTGLRWPNYVNGRLLTAQDLTTDHDAIMRRDGWLGRAIGPGIAEGLEVHGSPSSSVLQVPPGTGVSLGGTAVHLDAPAVLNLTEITSSAPVDGALFGDCAPATTSTKAPVAGPYLLVMRPASSYDGKVPVLGAPTATLPTPCTARWLLEDVAFVAIRLDGFTTPTTPANRRNLLAHWCFGSAQLDDLAWSGFTEPVPYSGLAALTDLSPCDLPLAVFQWTGSALTFVDRWSARRRPMRPSAATTGLVGGLATVVGDERTAEGEARFLQFQEQLAGLLETPEGQSVRALDVFPLLPPAGLVPFEPLVVAQQLVAQADFTATAADRPAPVTATAPAAAPAEDVSRSAERAAEPAGVALKDLLSAVEASSATVGGTPARGLGALSQQLAQMQQQIETLQAKVDDLSESPGGSAGPGGSGGQAAAAKVTQQQMAAAVVGVLADTAGVGFDVNQFFDGVQYRLGLVDRETVDFTIRRSWYDEPIELSKGPVVNLLLVTREEDGMIAPYLLFTKKVRGVRWFFTSTAE